MKIRRKRRLLGHNSRIFDTTFSPNGLDSKGELTLGSASEDGSVRVWKVNVADDTATPTCVRELRSGMENAKEEEMLRCSFSSGTTGMIAAGNSLGRVVVWDIEKGGEPIAKWSASTTSTTSSSENRVDEDPEQMYICTFAPSKDSGLQMLLVGGEHRMRELDVPTMRVRAEWTCKAAATVSIGGDRNPEKRNYVFDACFGYGGTVAAVACADGAVHLKDMRSKKVVTSLLGHDAFTAGCSFSPCSHSLASCAGDGTVCIWDCRVWKPRVNFCAHDTSVYGCAFSAQAYTRRATDEGPVVVDGRRSTVAPAGDDASTTIREQLVTWSGDGSVRWWDTDSTVSGSGADALKLITSQFFQNYPIYSCAVAPPIADCRGKDACAQYIAIGGGGGSTTAPLNPIHLYDLEWSQVEPLRRRGPIGTASTTSARQQRVSANRAKRLERIRAAQQRRVEDGSLSDATTQDAVLI